MRVKKCHRGGGGGGGGEGTDEVRKCVVPEKEVNTTALSGERMMKSFGSPE